jgi:hypothetical protein
MRTVKSRIKKISPILFAFLKKLKGIDYSVLLYLPKITSADYSKPILSEEEGNDFIFNLLQDDNPCLISRIGSSELIVLLNYIFIRKGKLKQWDMDRLKETLLKQNNVHFFPETNDSLVKFSEIYLACFKKIDGLGVWFNYGENMLHKDYFNKAALFPLEALEPFKFNDPWSKSLEGKKVLIILPFEKSVKTQYEIRSKLFDNIKVLPDFTLVYYRPFNAYTDYPVDGKTWFDTLEKMKNDIANLDFEIALVAAGPFGLPISAHIKDMGKKAIHVGGALQLLFGIKGSRWEERPEFQKFFNKYWIKPNIEDLPSAEMRNSIDNNAYW